MRNGYRVLLSIAVLVAMTALVSSQARADAVQVFLLTGSNAGGPACSVATPCAEVTIDISASGTTATFTVSSLLSGYIFDTFGFNSSASVSFIPGSGTGEIGRSYSLGGPGSFGQDGWGKFDFLFDTGKSGGSNGGDCVVTGGTPGPGCTFSFQVTGTGLTLADFEITSTNDSNGTTFIAGHMANATGPTGYVGQAVSEPGELPQLLLGLLFVGAFLGRRYLGASA
ncbi:MAG: hypothetical protein ACYDDI_09320 [Candidatus Acidiferrales bacterium]